MASWAYFDTSCLVKLLVAEAKTKECSEGFREAPRVVTSVIAWAEIPVALARKRTNGEVTPDQVRAIQASNLNPQPTTTTDFQPSTSTSTQGRGT